MKTINHANPLLIILILTVLHFFRLFFFQALYYIGSVIGIPGNIIAIIVFLSSTQLRRKPINLFFVHQSVIDLAVCAFNIIEEVFIEFDINGQGTCHVIISKTLSLIGLYTSTYNMTALTIERHFAIVNPLQYDPEKVIKRLPYIFIGTWIFCSVALSYIPISTVYSAGTCKVIHTLKGTTLWDVVAPYLVVIAIVIPCLIMVVCYTRMLLALKSSAKLLKTSNADFNCNSQNITNVDNLRIAQANIFQTCLIMMVVFLSCWLTIESAVILFIFKTYLNLSNNHYAIGRLLAVFNSCVNPYIYAIRYTDFKVQLKKLLRIGDRTGSSSPSNSQVTESSLEANASRRI